MPRILHVIASLGPTEPQGQLRLLCHSQVKQGWEVGICVLKPGSYATDDLTAAGISVTCLQQRAVWDPIALARFRWQLRRWEPELVHVWDFFSLGHCWPAVQVPWLASVWWLPPGLPVRVGQRLLRNARRIVTPTSCLRQRLMEWGLPSQQLAWIRPGVPRPAAVVDDSVEAWAELGFPPEARVVGSASPLERVDRVRDLVWAGDLLHLIREEVRLIVIRDGPCWRQIDRFTRQLEAEDYIRLLGETDPIVPWLSRLDVYWRTGDRMAASVDLLWAMAAGLPAVVSDTPAHRELVVPEETGCLEPLGGRAAFTQATDRLLDDPSRAQAMGAAAQARAETEFAAERMVAEHLELYREVGTEG